MTRTEAEVSAAREDLRNDFGEKIVEQGKARDDKIVEADAAASLAVEGTREAMERVRQAFQRAATITDGEMAEARNDHVGVEDKSVEEESELKRMEEADRADAAETGRAASTLESGAAGGAVSEAERVLDDNARWIEGVRIEEENTRTTSAGESEGLKSESDSTQVRVRDS